MYYVLCDINNVLSMRLRLKYRPRVEQKCNKCFFNIVA